MRENITEAYLNWFTSDTDFPFFIQYGGHDSNLYVHSHNDFNELVIVMEGSAVHIVNSEEYTIKSGDVFVVGNDTVHGYKDTENFRICNIMYRHSEMFSNLPDIASGAGFHALFVLEPRISAEHGFRNRLSLDRKSYMAVKSIIDEMMKEYESCSEYRKTMLTSLFLRLAATLSRLYRFDERENEQDILNIAKAASYIENHFSENISVAELARISHYSERHFLRVFGKAYGSTPHGYIINLRINCACGLLKSGADIAKTAEKCGFEDVNYFSRIFKKRVGIPPSAYRKK